jgi:hypothetical protein
MEAVMSGMSGKLLSIAVILLPSLALAENTGPAGDHVTREVEAMQRDGRWEKLLAEGRANKQAFEILRQAEQRMQQPAITYSRTGSIRPLQPR